MRRLNQLNSTRYRLMRIVESSTGQVEYSIRNSTLIQTSHFTCAELNALIILNYYLIIMLIILVLDLVLVEQEHCSLSRDYDPFLLLFATYCAGCI